MIKKIAVKTGEKIPKKNLGSTLDSFLSEQGILEECKAEAMKFVIASQLRTIMRQEKMSQAALARKMKTSKAAINRLLDPENPSITFSTLAKAAIALGKTISIKIK